MVSEMNNHVFSHDYDKFNYAPKCHLTDVQMKRVKALNELLEAIALHDYNELPTSSAFQTRQTSAATSSVPPASIPRHIKSTGGQTRCETH